MGLLLCLRGIFVCPPVGSTYCNITRASLTTVSQLTLLHGKNLYPMILMYIKLLTAPLEVYVKDRGKGSRVRTAVSMKMYRSKLDIRSNHGS